MRKLHRFWLAFGWLCVAAVVYLSLTPSPPDPVHVEHADKLEHALVYGFLMLWFCQDYRRLGQRVLLAALLVGLGVGMEFLQGLTGYRSFEYGDMLANSVGVLLGWAAACTVLGQIGAMLENRLSQKQP